MGSVLDRSIDTNRNAQFSTSDAVAYSPLCARASEVASMIKPSVSQWPRRLETVMSTWLSSEVDHCSEAKQQGCVRPVTEWSNHLEVGGDLAPRSEGHVVVQFHPLLVA